MISLTFRPGGGPPPFDSDFPNFFHPRPLRGCCIWETRTVQLNVRLPRDIAAQAEEVQKTDPEFLSRVVMYGLTRRSIYRHLKEQAEATEGKGDAQALLI